MRHDLDERARLVDALAATPGDEAARDLAELLKESSWSLRARAVDALASRGDSLSPTIAIVENGPWYAKASACDVLGRLEDPRGCVAIARALLDRNVSVQKSAAFAMRALAARHGDGVAGEALAKLPPAERRAAAARLVHQVPDLAVALAATLADSGAAAAVDDDASRETATIRRFRAWIASHVPDRERES